jgi:uncharacterized protein
MLPVLIVTTPLPVAIALTAVLHFFNNLIKAGVLFTSIDVKTVLLFGLPALAGSLFGSWLLVSLIDVPPLVTYEILGQAFSIELVKILIGLLLIGLGVVRIQSLYDFSSVDPKWLPVGGLASGFFGGISGIQGALRSGFLINLNLGKSRYIATGACIATLVDAARLIVYGIGFYHLFERVAPSLLAVIFISGLLGILTGVFFLKKITLSLLRTAISVLLFIFGLALCAGLL